MPKDPIALVDPDDLTPQTLRAVLTHFKHGDTRALPIGRDGKPEIVIISAERYEELIALEQEVAFNQTVKSRLEEIDSGQADLIRFEDLEK